MDTDELIEHITVDAYGDEGYWSFRPPTTVVPFFERRRLDLDVRETREPLTGERSHSIAGLHGGHQAREHSQRAPRLPSAAADLQHPTTARPCQRWQQGPRTARPSTPGRTRSYSSGTSLNTRPRRRRSSPAIPRSCPQPPRSAVHGGPRHRHPRERPHSPTNRPLLTRTGGPHPSSGGTPTRPHHGTRANAGTATRTDPASRPRCR